MIAVSRLKEAASRTDEGEKETVKLVSRYFSLFQRQYATDGAGEFRYGDGDENQTLTRRFGGVMIIYRRNQILSRRND